MINPQQKRVLSFDPGDSTGIAFTVDGQFFWGMVASPVAFQSESFFRALVTMTSPTTILVESPPFSPKFHNSSQVKIYNQVISYFKNMGIQVIAINPGQWKGMVKRSDADATHIRDAADMAAWFFRTQKG